MPLNSLPNMVIRSKPILGRLRRNHLATAFTLYSCRESSTNRPFFVQTNPNRQKAEITTSPVRTNTYGKTGPSAQLKTNPNEPKQSQSDPHFSLVMAPQSQNEPKQTQSKPNFKRDNLRGALHVCRYIFQAARGFFCPSPTFPYCPPAQLPFLQC